MVLLTMTDAIVKALEKLVSQSGPIEPGEDEVRTAQEPSLSEPAIDKPISHGQVIDISRQLKSMGHSAYHLDNLLRGSRVHIPPPPPKPEPTPEFFSLMARLHREEESRAYERMINPPPPHETFSQRFPTASAAYAFSSTAAYETFNSTIEEDDITYTDVNRQITLIFNILLSVVACAGAIWMVARWWNPPARLALSMCGSLLVGIAEVVVYSGYIRRLGEAKQKEGAVKEVKEIVKTWVIGGVEDETEKEGAESGALIAKKDQSTLRERRRQKESTS